ncbi:MAG TPA: sugar ABC transporter substrate-binding protein [Candidatus Dormibacteraeota bacterium]|nr:sugar ABC transporter substrate-binding protein [Candidatus Dormibacteraeota bacterium]
MHLRRMLSVIAALATLALTACGSSSSGAPSAAVVKGQYFILIRHGLPSDSFWAPVQKGFTDAGKLYGVKTTYEATGNNSSDEAKAIDAAVAQHVTGIVVTLPDAGAEGPAIERAEAAGIPVITINTGSTTYKQVGALTHVGQDETLAGQGAGERLKAAGLHHILCVLHQQFNVALEQRCAGAKQGFGGTVTNQYVPGTSDIPGTEASIKATLQSDSSIDGVLTLDPDIAMAAKDAIAAANSSAKLATFDLSNDVLTAIKQGKILFAVDQQPYLQGYLPVSFLVLYKENGNVVGGGQPVLTGPSFVDSSNVDKITACVKAGNC